MELEKWIKGALQTLGGVHSGRHFNWVFYVLALNLIFVGIHSYAQLGQSSPVQTAPNAAMPHSFPKVDCDNIENELKRLRLMSEEHNTSVAGFMDETLALIGQWLKQLLKLEGQNILFTAEHFEFLKSDFSEVSETQSMVWENMAVMDQRYDEILKVLPSCIKR